MTATLEAPVCLRHNVPMQQDPYRDGAGAARYVWRCPSMETIGTGRVPCNRAVRDDETLEEATLRWDRRHPRAIGRRQQRLDAALPAPTVTRKAEDDVKYTAEQREQVERLTGAGLSGRQVATQMGIPPGSVRRILFETRQRDGTSRQQQMSVEKRERVAEMLRQGATCSEIRRQVRCRGQIIAEVARGLRAQGVELRTRGQRPGASAAARDEHVAVAPVPTTAATALPASAPTLPIQTPAVEEPMTWREPYAEPPLIRAAAILRQMSFGDLLRLEVEQPQQAAAVRAVALIGM